MEILHTSISRTCWFVRTVDVGCYSYSRMLSYKLNHQNQVLEIMANFFICQVIQYLRNLAWIIIQDNGTIFELILLIGSKSIKSEFLYRNLLFVKGIIAPAQPKWTFFLIFRYSTNGISFALNVLLLLDATLGGQRDCSESILVRRYTLLSGKIY